ncbi:hypothetical protein EK21DRAFT_83284, partial [Setomelanomma holmii]
TYCSRCNLSSSKQRLQQHYDDSPSHYRCEICGYDRATWDELVEHYRKTEHRVVCQGCNDGDGMAWVGGSQEYLTHLKDENVCQGCEIHFQTASNLDHHRMVHLERSIRCYGCSDKFTTYSGMILHLESGTCDSEIDIYDLNESAAMCYQWKAYLDGDEPVFPFRCPECEVGFTKLSGLFQHVYSKACNQDLYAGKMAKLTNWLKKRHCKATEEE